MSNFRPFAIAGLGAVLVLSPLAVVAQGPFSSDPAQVQAGDYRFDSAHSKITWSINHFGYSTYVGQFSKVEGTVSLDPKKAADARLDVTIDAGSVGTLNPALDTHLKSADFLDTAKFPTATFKATTIKLTGKSTADITGDLTLHGVTRPVTVAATFNQGGVNPVDKTYSLGFAGKAKIKRTDFGITAYAPALGDEVTLELEAELKKVG
ncbi:YceI family protein [Caulobacter sp. NIBR1757]|uniref:YceI family protein n=1 Tax=Caulobacter sp. NIBR1757 TaxID=3016000 RepID=UPI0022F0FE2F|nr:YceI family protein [Caulobacter sp. NIBR1757]WGM37271.1 Protein YceI [Caulobacter sp. NIBR1757]